jgi:hypothetical protein
MRHLIRHYARELGFAGLAAAALAAGGGAALDGLVRFTAALTPGMEAQAAGPPVSDTVRLALPGFAESGRAPQVLYPLVANALPDWLRRPPVEATTPVVAICIDDLGEDLTGTEAAMRLPRAVALSFLPYAAMTPGFAARAREEGHTVLAHVPMQAIGPSNPGPMALQIGMPADEITRRLNWSLDRVPGAVGVNNHEGSRFTSDAEALAPVMAMLKARGLSSSTPAPAAVPRARRRRGWRVSTVSGATSSWMTTRAKRRCATNWMRSSPRPNARAWRWPSAIPMPPRCGW